MMAPKGNVGLLCGRGWGVTVFDEFGLKFRILSLHQCELFQKVPRKILSLKKLFGYFRYPK